jgi:preprotein translocase subunit SecD
MKKPLICLVAIQAFITCFFGGCVSINLESTTSATTLTPSLTQSGKSQNYYSILLEADLSNVRDNVKTVAVKDTISVISKRLEEKGINVQQIQQQEEGRILIKIPATSDIVSVKNLLTEKGLLEFREVELNAKGEPVYLGDYLQQETYQFIDSEETGSRIFASKISEKDDNSKYKTIALLSKVNDFLMLTDATGKPLDKDTLTEYALEYASLVSWIPARSDDGTALTGDFVKDAQATMDMSEDSPKPVVSIRFDDDGAKMFDQIAARIHNRAGFNFAYDLKYTIGLFLDNDLISAPMILQNSYGGSGEISGNLTMAEATQMAIMLKSKALPVPVRIVEISSLTQ